MLAEWSWLARVFGTGRGARAMPLPRSLARLTREISEKRRSGRKRGSGKRYKVPSGQKPDGTAAGGSGRRRLASGRHGQLKTGQCLTWTKSRPHRSVLVVSVQNVRRPGAISPRCSTVPRVEGPAEDPVGRGAEGDREVEVPVHNSGTSLPTGGAARRYVLDFLSTTDPMWEGWFRLRRARGVRRQSGSGESGERGKWSRSGVRGSWALATRNHCVSLPTPSLMASAGEA